MTENISISEDLSIIYGEDYIRMTAFVESLTRSLLEYTWHLEQYLMRSNNQRKRLGIPKRTRIGVRIMKKSAIRNIKNSNNSDRVKEKFIMYIDLVL